MIPYRLTPPAVTAIWRRTSLCVHELTGPRNLWSGVTSGTSRTAPPTAGQAGACSTQTMFGPWLVTAIQPQASHTTSINRGPIEGIGTSRARTSQSTPASLAPAMPPQETNTHGAAIRSKENCQALKVAVEVWRPGDRASRRSILIVAPLRRHSV
jgi:hypothetical protein